MASTLIVSLLNIDFIYLVITVERRTRQRLHSNLPQQPKMGRQTRNRLLTSSQDAPSHRLFDVPSEVLILIIERLPMPSRLLLALTCKGLHSFITHPQSRLVQKFNKTDRAEFLLTLQRDIPNVYHCFGCYKLRPLNSGVDWKGQGHWECFQHSHWTFTTRRMPKFLIPLLWHPGASEANVMFMEAFLVMDRHLHGESYGLPLSTLERRAAFEKYIMLSRGTPVQPAVEDNDSKRPCITRDSRQTVFDQKPEEPCKRALKKPWRFSFRYTPRIINNELYIARCHTIHGPLVSWELFTKLINSIHLPVCHHMQCYAKKSLYCRLLVQSAHDRSPAVTPRFDGCHQIMGSCHYCYSDFDSMLRHDADKKEWSLKICTYHYLGPCRSPEDGIWERLTSPPECQQPADVRIGPRPLLPEALSESEHGKARQKWFESLLSGNT